MFWDRYRNLLHVPGPSPLPMIGNVLMLSGPEYLFLPKLKRIAEQYGPVFRLHFGSRPSLLVASPENCEKILSSATHNNKGRGYKPMRDCLGEGILISTGAKWHSRRKL